MGEKVELNSFLNLALDGMSDQLHNPTALPLLG